MKLSIAVFLGIACSLSAQTKAPSRPMPKPSDVSSSYFATRQGSLDSTTSTEHCRSFVVSGQSETIHRPFIPPLQTGSPSVAANAAAASKPVGAPPDWRAPHAELNATAASAAVGR